MSWIRKAVLALLVAGTVALVGGCCMGKCKCNSPDPCGPYNEWVPCCVE